MADDVDIQVPGPLDWDTDWDTDWAMVWTIEDARTAALREFHQTAAIAQAFATGGRDRGLGRS